jgi:hypothetical protein
LHGCLWHHRLHHETVVWDRHQEELPKVHKVGRRIPIAVP